MTPKKIGFHADALIEAVNKISSSMAIAPSIDNFLDSHQNDKAVVACGKLAIARSISRAESRSIINSIGSNSDLLDSAVYADTWIGYLARRLFEGVSASNLSVLFRNVDFITFNYDRCIEQCLGQAIRSYFHVTAAESNRLLSTVNVLHPYGSLGNLEYQGQRNAVPFGKNLSRADLIEAAGRLRTFTEQLRSSEMDQIRNLYSNAQHIVFLGFAFHEINMSVLSSENRSVRSVFGTVFQVPGNEINLNEAAIRSSLGAGSNPDIALASMKAAEMIKDFGRAMSS